MAVNMQQSSDYLSIFEGIAETAPQGKQKHSLLT